MNATDPCSTPPARLVTLIRSRVLSPRRAHRPGVELVIFQGHTHP